MRKVEDIVVFNRNDGARYIAGTILAVD